MVHAADRNLLFGILAVQMDFVAADELIAGMNAWVLDKSRPLGAHLIDSGALAADTHALIQALVDKHVEQHGGRVEQSLAALSSAEGLRQDLAEIADADVQTSLAHACQATPRNDGYATIAMPTREALAGDQRFEILRPHASGGLGKVSVARDAQLNREVALKELHDRHADNLNSRARFVQEAEITGGLEHPGVVPIYGLGQYADGRPFYAMRFIRGDSLGQAIERFHEQADEKWSRAADGLQLRRLLARLIDVCNAMEYAHSRGVLHRDLKPGNIMLGRYGETLVVDWGLAKPLGREGDPVLESSDVTPTAMAEAALTPQSGSGSAPTQMGSAVGTPAFMSPEQAAGRLDELGPASDVYSLGATLYVLLTGRPPQDDGDLGVVIQRVMRGQFPPPRSVKPAVPRALEAICLKAMALAPEDRYPSPRQLADDVEAWLADEPVQAMREPWTARGRRWVKKHRTLVSTAAAMLVVALASLAAFNVQLSAANDREREAKHAALAAKSRAEKAQAEVQHQSERNEELLQLSRASLERYETLSKSEQLSRHGMESLRRELQEAAIEYYATLADQAGESEQARADRANAYHRLGSTHWQMGRIDQGLETIRQSLAMYQQLEKDFPDNPAYQRGTALAYAAIGELMLGGRQARQAAEPLAASRQRLKVLHAAQQDDYNVATLYAYGFSLEGERLRQLGQMEDAAASFAQAVELLRTLDQSKLGPPEVRDVQFRLARALYLRATLESQTLWRFETARENFREARTLMRALFDADPANGDLGCTLAQILGDAGFMEARENRFGAAREMYEQALEVMQRVERANPDVPPYRVQTAELLNSIGALQPPLSSAPPSAESVAQLEEAVAIGAQMYQLFPQETERQVSLARFRSTLGAAYQQLGREEDARAEFDAALVLLEDLGARTGGDVDTLFTLGEMQTTIGDLLMAADRHGDALEAFESADRSLHELEALAPDFKEVHLSLANLYISRSNCCEAEGRLVDAIVELDRVVAKSADIGAVAGVDWIESALNAIIVLAKTARLGHMIQIREGSLKELADEGRYELAAGQAREFARLTGEASDHYVAAQTLAYAAQRAGTDAEMEAAQREALAESLAAEAVREIEAAWIGGYIRRTGGFAGLFSARPTAKSVRGAEDFRTLHERGDFQALVDRIATEDPPEPTPADSANESPAGP